MITGKVYLIPTVLHDDELALKTLPVYLADAIKNCAVFFTENEKTTRRFFKKLWKEMVIDDFAWYTIHKAEAAVKLNFLNHLKEGKNVGIISEAGCPGIADPGQLLIEVAQNEGITILPLVGPSSILLALMASGMNGQCFQFVGYLPIESSARKKMIKDLEEYSFQKNCTQIFIETPYRNNQMIHDIISVCKPETKFCIAAEITASSESIRTKKIREWKNSLPDFHKKPVIYLIYAGL